MWGSIIAIIAIICGTLIAVDKHRNTGNSSNDDLNQRITKLEQEVNDLKSRK
ncbi:hypothetical protein [Lactobacillus sp. Sy-1]|uniref:hypothetical protein n=1 Tax=Lactobacillus sp. Sy-1 TaxID=2109645 RepID=UPI001C5AD225|nr:hypothetical protein [Lactobacillus sp. Sy-1]MBW1606263.1 hypothetical protein [Lactobacillus sp. Sy-1]